MESHDIVIPALDFTDYKEKAFLNDFEDYFENELSISHAPGAAVVIVKDGAIAFIKGFGVRAVGSPEQVDENTVFRIGSLSKGFSGVLAAKLIEEEQFKWDDKVTEAIPNFTLKDTAQADRITVKNILSHSTGIGRHSYTNLIDDGMSLDDIIPKFSTLNPYGKEGQMYAYQNAAFAMIEKIIEVKTGKSYPEWISSLIFKPAGMTNASTSREEILANTNTALPHRRGGNLGFYPAAINSRYYNAVSAGGINASISDMGNWLKVLMGNRPDIISPASLDSVFSPIIRIGGRKSYHRWEGVKSAYYGIGWRILKYEDKEIAYHGGYVNNYVSQIAIDRESNIGICVLFNGVNSTVSKVIPEFLKRYNDYKSQMDKVDFTSIGPPRQSEVLDGLGAND